MSNQLTVIRNDISAMKPEFAKALPAHVTPEKFERTTMTAIANNPDILACDKTSILSSCMKAAQDGLILDGKEAALVKFGNKAQYMPMVAGIMKLVRNSGELSSLTAQIVCQNDKFSYNPASGDAPQHEPDWFGTRGNMIGVYAVAKLKDGSIVVEILSKADVDSVRKRSRSGTSGPWVTDYNEMARKTAIRKISKYLPKSTDRDSERVFDAVERMDEDFDDTIPETPVTPSKRTKRAAEILNAETIEVNPETGEVMDGAGSVTEPVGEPAESDVM
jgi:recombination protein RecT